jgi:hypothetical protein
MYNQQSTNSNFPVSGFNYDSYSKELSDRFGRLIKQLSPVNKSGTQRYAFEVDFMYALNEIKNCPPYLQGKMFDKANNVVASLMAALKHQEESQHQPQEVSN